MNLLAQQAQQALQARRPIVNALLMSCIRFPVLRGFVLPRDLQYVALNPDSPWSGHFRFIVHFSDRKQSFNKTEPFQRFFDLFAVLTSLEGFPAGSFVENFKSTWR